jgi:uncharacterized protein DUF4349
MTHAARAVRAFLAALLIAPAACGQNAKAPAAAAPMQLSRLAEAPKVAQSPPPDMAPRGSANRYIAVRQFLALEVEAEQVEQVLKDALAACAAPQCEVLESSLSRDGRGAPPRAHLALRIAPPASGAFLDTLERRGDVIERRTESEDKTGQVIDVEARLKNMVELRDRLRKLLSAHGATVKDLVEVESQLARVQTDLDAATGLRKALADETEKVTINVELRSRRGVAESGTMEPIRDALRAIGHTFAQSVASLIGFVVAVLPWTILLIPAIWWWRRRRLLRATLPRK